MRRQLIALLASLGLLLAAGTQAGCSTIEGAGKDLSKAGNAIRDAARDAQR